MFENIYSLFLHKGPLQKTALHPLNMFLYHETAAIKSLPSTPTPSSQQQSTAL